MPAILLLQECVALMTRKLVKPPYWLYEPALRIKTSDPVKSVDSISQGSLGDGDRVGRVQKGIS